MAILEPNFSPVEICLELLNTLLGLPRKKRPWLLAWILLATLNALVLAAPQVQFQRSTRLMIENVDPDAQI